MANICAVFAESARRDATPTEKLSHGEPTFFAHKKVFVMFADNHHNDGHVAVWITAQQGLQPSLIEEDPRTYFKPPYIGVRGWIGIELDRISDEDLAAHIREAWHIIAPKKAKVSRASGAT
jgi:hypothetical protein